MIENFLLVIGLFLIGNIMRRTSLFPANTADVLNQFVLNIPLPAIIILSISKLEISSDILIPVSIHWGLYFICFLLVLGLGKLFSITRSALGCLLVVTCLGNTVFLGIPVIHSFYGEEAIPYAILYDQLGSGLAFIAAKAFLIPYFTDEKTKSIKELVIDLIKFPPFVALVIGFICIGLPLGELLTQFLEKVASPLIPCALIAVGFQMKYRMSPSRLKPVAIGLIIRLILVPVIGLIFFNIFHLEYLSARVSLVQSGMPPMVTAGALAMSVGLEKEISAALVGYGLILSLISLPILKFLI